MKASRDRTIDVSNRTDWEELAGKTVAALGTGKDTAADPPGMSLHEMANELFSHLREAVRLENPDLFTSYVAWLDSVVRHRGQPRQAVIRFLDTAQTILKSEPDTRPVTTARAWIEQESHRLASTGSSDSDPAAATGGDLKTLAKDYLEHLLHGRRHDAGRLIEEALDRGESIKAIYLDVFQWSQHEIGRLWQLNRISVAQEHFCTAATQMIMSLCYPRIACAEKNGRRFVGTCVGGELHELGIRMVCDFLEMEGWETDYLGASTPVPDLLAHCRDREADILGVSAAMTFHVGRVAEVVDAVRADEQLAGMKILVGGHPFKTVPTLWNKVGADAFALDAVQAVERADELAQKDPHS